MNKSNSTDPVGEQLSALMDGELPPDQLRFLLRRIDAEAPLAERWSRYQTARAALRRQPLPALRVDFAEIVMQRLAHEAAPAAARNGRVLRWLGGGAIAASVAVLALVATRPALQPAPAGTIAAVAAPAATLPDSRPVLPAAAAPAPMPLQTFDLAQPAAWELPYGRPSFGAQPPQYLMARGTPLLPLQAAPAERKPPELAPRP